MQAKCKTPLSPAYILPSPRLICITSKMTVQGFLWYLLPLSILTVWSHETERIIQETFLISGAGYGFKGLQTVLLLIYQSNFKFTFGSPMYFELCFRQDWFSSRLGFCKYHCTLFHLNGQENYESIQEGRSQVEIPELLLACWKMNQMPKKFLICAANHASILSLLGPRYFN